jgi:AraC-like DNA-binding protein
VALLLDTRTVAPEHRREAWASVHAQALFPLSIGFTDGSAFSGRAESHELGALSLLRFRGSASTVRRTPRTIRAGDPGHLVVALTLGGPCAVRQGGRQAVLARGDLTTWDSSRPFEVPHDGRFDLLLLSAPIEALGVGHTDTARCAPGASGAGALAGAFLRELWQQLDEGALAPDDPNLQDALIAVARSVHGAPRGAGPGASTLPPRTLAPRVRAYAERHLGDPDLGPASLARAHHVSVRLLHVAFAAEQETLSSWIRRRRLEHCLEDLTDPALAHVPISAIATRWGLSNHAHFSRAFRATYGLSPTQARRAAVD